MRESGRQAQRHDNVAEQQSPLDMSRSPQEHSHTTRSGISFRVLAHDGTRPNYTRYAARNPNAPKTVGTLRAHLRWHRINVQTPWYSTYWDWSLALGRAEWYISVYKAHNVCILMLDQEKLGPAIDAFAFAERDAFPKPWIHRAEHLYHGMIPQGAILGFMPASHPWDVKDLCTGLLAAPRQIFEDSMALYEPRLCFHKDEWQYIQALREWFYDHFYAHYICFDRIKVDRLLDSMFIEHRKVPQAT